MNLLCSSTPATRVSVCGCLGAINKTKLAQANHSKSSENKHTKSKAAMQAGLCNGCKGTQSVHIAPREQSKMALRACWTSAGAQATRHTHRIKRKPEGAKTTGSGGDHGSRNGAPTNTKNQGDASTSADNEPLRAVSPPVPPTRDDRPTIRLLSLLLSLPRTTTSDHPRAIFPPVPQTRNDRPTMHAPSPLPFRLTRDDRVTIRSLSLLPPPKRDTLT